MEKSREALLKEADVIRLIRSHRFVHLALKHLLDPEVRKALKSQSHLREIDFEDASTSPADEKQDGDTKVPTNDMSNHVSTFSRVVSDCQMADRSDDYQTSEKVPQ